MKISFLFLQLENFLVAKKPSYEKLERKIKELEKQAVERKRAAEELKAQKNALQTIVDSVASGIDIVTYDYKVQFQNKLLVDKFGDLRGKLCYEEYMNRAKPCSDCPMRKAIENNRVERTESLAANGRNYELISTPIKNPDGTMSAVEIVSDITERKQIEGALRQREVALEARTIELEEVNTALRVLLKKRARDKTKLGKEVLSNVKELIMPYIQKLKRSRMDAEQISYLKILESNLNNIIAPFLHKLSSKYLNLTPKEIRVAGLVKEGKTTKEIAELLISSTETIEFHRKNIRKKLGLKNTKTNLRTYLLDLS
jgi:DNA-binding CsgD family transcriptional regulator